MKINEALSQRSAPFFSLEFFPPSEAEQWPDFFAVVEKLCALNPLFASVTYGAGGAKQQNTLEISEKISTMGLVPMPHLTCVNANREKIANFLGDLQVRGIHNVLALRGDAPADPEFSWDKGEFRHASDLVRFVRKEFPSFCVGVAGYPSAHPESPSFASDVRYTKDKLDAGADVVVTQVFFDPREYFSMVERLRNIGVTKPVIPGILPIQSLESMRRILRMCGANIPGQLYLALEEANERGGAKAVREEGLQFAVRLIRRLIDNGAPGIHLYTLNRAGLCLRIAEEAGIA